MKVQFFTGLQCSLCDLAQHALSQVKGAEKLEVEMCNVRDNTDWYHLYCARIPVLKRADTGQEIGWPFTTDDLETFFQ
ncbi:glutaredoxin family protein [Alteromonas sp. ASW11-19]|uniref:Glutaredoxin family protein n=1 Tax=Alteromonas salexigens TaxID=2982530 RepID=A0ABT2VLH3_9ALTE|nr:glutaredoxin family protein [Alteromonas salexigens]MCU7554161.1 glutaredoxin family protein [Alteromonas salexigens]